MKQTKTILQNNIRRLWKKAVQNILMAALLVGILLGNGLSVSAQFTFMGDYDKTFNAPLGYNVDPQFPDPTVNTSDLSTGFGSGDLMSDGSIIAGGGFRPSFSGRTTFYIRKYLPSGALDTSFNSSRGFIRTDFFVTDTFPPATTVSSRAEFMGKLKVLPDDKILVVGVCDMSGVGNTGGGSGFVRGKGVCMMRFNPNGTLDTTFGTAGDFLFAPLDNPTITANYREHPGMVWTPVGNQQMLRYPAETENLDVVIQPDGKILVAGTTRTRLQPDTSNQVHSGFLLRYTSQGALDTTFGNNGAIHYFSNPATPSACTTRRRFMGVTVQPDGRIIAVGSDGTINLANNCTNTGAHANRFVVTRWTANGQLETTRYLDDITEHVGNRDEGAFAALITRDGSKVLISGTYKNLPPSPNPTYAHLISLLRLNLSDLSLDTAFGIKQFSAGCVGAFCGSTAGGGTFRVKAIQPDGRIIATEASNRVFRFNPDGSSDQSFGNVDAAGVPPHRGGLDPRGIVVYSGFTNQQLSVGQIILRPNGRINLIGAVGATSVSDRAAVSQQNTVFKNGNYSDFTNDGKSELAVFRPNGGVWHQLDSLNNNYSAVQWGISTDKPAPADFDGDGKTDRAVFRDGIWYIYQSSNGQVRIENFGLAGDLPRPGDFDGDGKADISVFRPSDGIWYRLNSSNGQFAAIQFGQNGDVPMLGDYDADGRTDFAVFRPSNSVWYILRSSDGQIRIDVFGTSGDIPLNGDFNGDSRADLAVFRPSNRTWYIARPTGVPGQNFDAIPFGIATDVPVAADYDNDGKTDLAVYRSGTWWIQTSGNNQVSATQFGLSGDKPIPAAYLP